MSILITYFSGRQDDLFWPAYAVALLGALLIAAPIVLAPVIRRMRARRLVIAGLAVGVLASALGSIALAVPAVHTIDRQLASVRTQIEQRYGLTIPMGTVARLVNGDTTAVPQTGSSAKVHFAHVSGLQHRYILLHNPATSSKELELPLKG